MSDETTLLPCPFCGGEASNVWIPYIGGGGYGNVIECDDCWVKTGYYDTEAEAITAWNTRAERTCKVVASELDGQMWVFRHEFSCDCGQRNYFTASSEPPNYCPSCGAKVVNSE